MGSPNIPTHIPCASCNSEIDADADACPDCGKPNEWVNPILLKLIDYAKARYVSDIDYEAKGNKLSLFKKRSYENLDKSLKILILIFSCFATYIAIDDILNHDFWEIRYLSTGKPWHSIISVVILIGLLSFSIFSFLDISGIYKIKSQCIKVDLRKNPAIISVSREHTWKDIINYINAIESHDDISSISGMLQNETKKQFLYKYMFLVFIAINVILIIAYSIYKN